MGAESSGRPRTANYRQAKILSSRWQRQATPHPPCIDFEVHGISEEAPYHTLASDNSMSG